MSIAGSSGQTLISLQVLRAIAALLVVVYHAGKATADTISGLPLSAGRYGVDIFFVISAFVMIATTQDRPGMTDFFRRRLLRVAPLYWLFTILAAVFLLIDPSALLYTAFSVKSLVLSLLFIPHENLGNPGVATPLFLIGWTLNFEMYFYLLLGIAMTVSQKYRAYLTGAVVVLVVLLRNAGLAPGVVLDFYGSDIVLEFVFGMVIAHLWLAGRLPSLPAPIAWAGLGLGIAVPFVAEAFGLKGLDLVIFGGSAVLSVVSALSLEPWFRTSVPQVLRRLGDASYSLYLIHIFVIVLFAQALAALGVFPQSITGGLVFVVTATFLSSLAALYCYRLIERPLIRAFRKPPQARAT